MELNKVYNMDCLEGMKQMADNSVDLVVTSPPYDNLRDYKGYSFDFETTAKEICRILKEGGVIVWVVSDSVVDGSETGTSFKQALFFKSLGLNLHDTMIYEKSGMSHPDNIRYYNIFEYMFIFSKGKPKTINLIADKKNKWAGTKNFGKHTQRQKDGSLLVKEEKTVKEIGIRWNIWRYNTGFGYTTKDEYAFEHPAMFPEALAKDHIISWSNEEDIILDPFAGAGTTLKMAKQNRRKYIGFEISKDYVKICLRRLEQNILPTEEVQEDDVQGTQDEEGRESGTEAKDGKQPEYGNEPEADSGERGENTNVQ
ncbi:site-specific DNA-methyltransferase [Candidatus Dojkabacteria bacterium]|jgi:site-specific DNA-methyltransferase (adenine-specific)|nr:site-specific DNA-methyltransferase [Candidatus Dojkabacteria bacterium]